MEVEKDTDTNVTSVTKPRLQIQNVVSTFFLGRKKLNLKKICPRLKYLEYNPNKFAAASMRIAYPRCTALVFNSGNIVCTGSKDEKSSRLACRQCVNVLQRSGLRVGFTKFKIQNIVGSCALDHPIDLIQMKKDYGPYTSYEPELSGRLVCTGGRSEKQIHKYFNGFYELVLRRYLDKDNDLRCSSEYRYKNIKKEFGFQYFYDALK